MTKILSRYFGSFEMRKQEVIHFPSGVPGFEDQTDYAALSIPGQEPILYLQSVSRPELCLITLPARVFDPDYRLELGPGERQLLDMPSGCALKIGTDVACQVIVTVDENREPTANLAAPLVVNLSNHLAVQVFQESSNYSFRHPLAESLQLAEC